MPTECPDCQQPIKPSDTLCRYCGARLAATPMAREAPIVPPPGRHHQPIKAQVGNLCPRCATPLSATIAADTQLYRCRECHGVWLDPASYHRLLADPQRQGQLLALLKPHTLGAPETRAPVPCPACGRLMNVLQFADGLAIFVDACQDHGMWFDRDELRQILDHAQRLRRQAAGKTPAKSKASRGGVPANDPFSDDFVRALAKLFGVR